MTTSFREARALWLLGGAVAAVLFVQTWARAERPGGIDLTSYLEAARVVAHGGNPYLPTAASAPYIYPLFLAFVLIPLAYVPPPAALVIWFVASIAALVWITRTMLRVAYPDLNLRTMTPFAAALFTVMYPVIQSNLRNGQVNFFVLAFCVAALLTSTSQAPARAALAWATAVAIKIVPAVLGPFFARRGHWSSAAGALILAAALCFLPIVTMGADVFTLTRSYVASFIGGSFNASPGTDPIDFSAGAMLVRTISGVPTLWLRAIGALGPLAIVVASDRRTRRSSHDDACAFASYLAIVPLISPKSEVHHLVFALPAAAVAIAAIWYGLASRRRAVAALLAIAGCSYLAALVVRSAADVFFFVALTTLTAATIALPRGVCRTGGERREGTGGG